MSDFLTRLAQRSLGAGPLIAPRLPSLFAPAEQEGAARSISSFISQNASEMDGAIAVSSQSASPLLLRAHRRERETLEAGDAARASSPPAAVEGEKTAAYSQFGAPQQREGNTTFSHDAPMSAHPLPSPSPLEGEGLLLGDAPNDVAASDAGHVSKNQKYMHAFSASPLSGEGGGERGRSFTAQSPLVSAHKIKSSEAHSLSAVAVELSDQQRSAAPTIHISIGRVEVRANIATPPQAPRPRAESKPTQSLADYLKRGGGKP